MDTPLTLCPDENALLAMMDGLLEVSARDEIEAHLDQCPACAELMIALGHLGAPLDPLAVTAAAPSPPSPSRPRLGRYIIGQLLGMGGMGAVYEGFDPSLRRRVAIKILRPDLLDQAPLRARHKREARALALLSHPHVLTVFDAGEEEDGRLWFAMAMVDGLSFPDWIVQDLPDWRQIIAAYLNIASGLDAAHRAGVLHRDIKPQNMMIQRDGRPVLVDFGLANASNPALLHSTWAEHPPSQTSAGIVVGTPYYMAPEQLAGQHIDARADQFSWCVSLYESLYGARPFIASSLEALLSQLQSATLTRPRGDQIPASIFEILVKGLSPRPYERYEDLRAISAALEAALAPPPTQKTRRLVIGIVTSLVLATVTATALLSWPPTQHRSILAEPLSASPALPETSQSPSPSPIPALRASAQALASALNTARTSSTQASAQASPPQPQAPPHLQSSHRDRANHAPLAVGASSSPAAGAKARPLIAPAAGTSPSPAVQHGPQFLDEDRALAQSLYQSLNSRWIMACMSLGAFAPCRAAIQELRREVRAHGDIVSTLLYLRDQGANPNSLKITTGLTSAFLAHAYKRAGEAQECTLALELFSEFQRVHADLISPKSDFHHALSRDRARQIKLLTTELPSCEGTL